MTKQKHELVAVPLDEATVDRIEALAPRLSEDRPMAQSAVLRMVLLLALDKAEKDPEGFAAELRAER
jgi:hypothetical protein